MPIKFSCQCGNIVTAPDGSTGKKGKCKQCGAVLTIPPAEPAQQSADQENSYDLAEPPAPPTLNYASSRSPQPPPLATGSITAAMFGADRFILRQKVFTFLHRKFHLFDESEQNILLFSQMKAFKFKEDIRLFSDESMSTELLRIQARSIIDFSAAYDIIDSSTNARIGVARRKGWSSMIRDSWELLDAREQPLGTIMEDSTLKALVRRFIDAASFLMPQAFHVEVAGATVAIFKQNFNPFVRKLMLDFTPDTNRLLDRRLGIAACILMMAIEGKQQ